MNLKRMLLPGIIALASHGHAIAQLQALPATCVGSPFHMRGGTPAGPAWIGTNFAVHWATPIYICQPPPLSTQVLLIGSLRAALFDFGGPCRTAVCTVVDVLPALALPPNTTSGSSGWVFPLANDPTLRGVTFDVQVVVPTCVTFLPGVSCLATSKPTRITIQ